LPPEARLYPNPTNLHETGGFDVKKTGEMVSKLTRIVSPGRDDLVWSNSYIRDLDSNQ
jgi:hypothetical protein